MKSRILTLLLVVALFAGFLIPHHWQQDRATNIQGILQSLRSLGTTGFFITIALQVAVTISGIMPASILAMAAGAGYGITMGFVISAIGTIIGALVAFWLSRSIFRPFITRYIAQRARWQNFDRAIARDGWRFVCLIRLSPVMPFAFTSYSIGLSSISFRDYLIGTCASLPALGLYVFLGTLAHVGYETLTSPHKNPWILFFLLVGGVSTVVTCVRVGQLAMRAASRTAQR